MALNVKPVVSETMMDGKAKMYLLSANKSKNIQLSKAFWLNYYWVKKALLDSF